MRTPKWNLDPEKGAAFRPEEYRHLAELCGVAAKNPDIAALRGSDYVITPDVLIVREPRPAAVIDTEGLTVDGGAAMPWCLRQRNGALAILHASISCKWRLRSDRAQNARSEALNLFWNRKGRLPHIAVVTGEPLPSRLASLALGTRDLDCLRYRN